MEKTKQIHKQEQNVPKISFEDLCPDFDNRIKENGYDNTLNESFKGKHGKIRSLNNPRCCIVGEAFDCST